MKCVSVATASCGCASSMRCSRVVPERGQPTTNRNGFWPGIVMSELQNRNVGGCRPDVQRAGLQLVQPGVEPIPPQELPVSALLDDAPVLHVQDEVRARAELQVVADEERGAAHAQVLQTLDDRPVVLFVEAHGGLGED